MEQKAMRAVFGEELVLLGAEYPQMVVLDSDTSSSTQTRLFGQAYPDRFSTVESRRGICWEWPAEWLPLV